jgi:ketosteroid isomerase-like protein
MSFTAEERNALAVRHALEVLGGTETREISEYEDVYCSEVIDHPWWHDAFDPMTGERGETFMATPALLRDWHRQLRDRFTEMTIAVDDVMAFGAFVIARYTTRGLHRTGRRVTYRSVDVFRFVDGRIAEVWNAWDRLGLCQQLGLVPDTMTLMRCEAELDAHAAPMP